MSWRMPKGHLFMTLLVERLDWISSRTSTRIFYMDNFLHAKKISQYAIYGTINKISNLREYFVKKFIVLMCLGAFSSLAFGEAPICTPEIISKVVLTQVEKDWNRTNCSLKEVPVRHNATAGWPDFYQATAHCPGLGVNYYIVYFKETSGKCEITRIREDNN